MNVRINSFSHVVPFRPLLNCKNFKLLIEPFGYLDGMAQSVCHPINVLNFHMCRQLESDQMEKKIFMQNYLFYSSFRDD